MKASAAVVAVAASASAQTLLSPLLIVDRAVSAGPLADLDITRPPITRTSNATLTSASTSTASLTPRQPGWTTRIRKVASASDLVPAAAAAPEKQMAPPTPTWDMIIEPTDVEADPVTMLRIAEHQDMLPAMKTTATASQGKQTFAMVSADHAPNVTEAGTLPPPPPWMNNKLDNMMWAKAKRSWCKQPSRLENHDDMLFYVDISSWVEAALTGDPSSGSTEEMVLAAAKKVWCEMPIMTTACRTEMLPRAENTNNVEEASTTESKKQQQHQMMTTTQGEQPRVTQELKGTIRPDEIVDSLKKAAASESEKQQKQHTMTM